jgi:hypothetical protein
LGNGDGTFGAHMDYHVPGEFIYELAVGDFNRDGKLDLAVTVDQSAEDSQVVIFLGNGDGTFQTPVGYVTGVSGGTPTVADFNGDGIPDLIIGAPGTVGSILLGNGDGSFQQPMYVFLGTGTIAVADFNQDGSPDLAAGNAYGSATIAVSVMLSTAFKAVSPASLNFGSQGVGTTSLARAVTISNSSNVSFNIASIVASGNFSQTNDCGASLPIGDHCSVNVTFAPTTTGPLTGAITVTDSTKVSPVAISLSGTGVNGPFLTRFPSRVNFSPQNQGVSSSPTAIMLMNTGNAALSLSSIGIKGPDASDFSLKNACGSSLAAKASCSVNVTFTPTAGGSRTASVSVNDSAPGSPQMIALSGTGAAVPDFAIGPASGSSNSATITAGQTTSFNLAVTPAGSFSGTVNLSCAITPAVTPAPVCTVPASVNVTQGTAAAATAKISTTAAGSAGSISQADLPPPGRVAISGTIVLLASGLLLVGYRRRLPALVIPMIGVVLWGMSACGGGGGSSSMKTPGTPAGTYTATVTAKSGSLTHGTTLTVLLQ